MSRPSSVYTALSKPDSIRLLKLNPASNKNIPLMGSLVNTTLRECRDDLFNRYTAVSYVWGDPLPTDALAVGDNYEAIGVATNLATALRSVRHQSQALMLWVDAICINQVDLTERANQVRLMGTIYFWAASTIIYLGSPKTGVEVLFDAAHAEHTKHLGMEENGQGGNGTEKEEDNGQAAHDQSSGDVTIAKESRLALIGAIGTFCSYTWFGRSWVFQELLFSHDPCVQCGHLRARWTELLDILGNARSGYRGSDVTTVSKLPLAMDEKLRMRSYGSQTMLDLIRTRVGSHATDPRDYFFPLMGLATDRNKVHLYLQVDYRLSVRDVYVAAATYVLDTVGLHQYLRTHLTFSSPSTPNSPLRGALPGWVLDWSLRTPWIPEVAEKPGLEDIPQSFPHTMVYKGKLTLPMVEATTTSSGQIEQISAVLPPNIDLLFAETGYTDDSDMAPYHFWSEWIYPLIIDMPDEARGPWSNRYTAEYHATMAEWYLMCVGRATRHETREYRLARIRSEESIFIIHMVPASAAVDDVIFAAIELVDSLRFFKRSYDRVGITNGDTAAKCCIVGRPLHCNDKKDDALISKHMADVCWNRLQDGLGHISSGDLVKCFDDVRHFEFVGLSQAPRSLPTLQLGVYTTVSGVAVIH